MARAPGILLHSPRPTGPTAAGYVRLTVELPVCEGGLPLWVDAPDCPLHLGDIVPLAQEICDIVVGLTVRAARENGRTVYCQKGCSACCSYLVELSVPEAFRLIEDLGTLPTAEIHRIQLALSAAEKTAIDAGLLEIFKDVKDHADDPKRHEIYTRWYRKTDARCLCPMLADDACAIHTFRLTACRQLNAISPPETCAKRNLKALVMPVNVGLALGRLASELEGTLYQLLILPMLVHWAAGNLHRAKRAWPGVSMVRRFLDILPKCVSSAKPSDVSGRKNQADES